MSLIFVTIALGVCQLLRPLFGIENVDLVFLTAVIGAAVRYGLLPSLLASIAASLCYNFFFSAADLYLHHRRPDQCRGVFLFYVVGLCRVERGGACTLAGSHGDQPGADDGVSVFVQPQARRHRDA